MALALTPALRFLTGTFAVVLGLASTQALADDAGGATSSATPQASGNYYKDQEFLPGENVVTPTGQKLKVWSTQGAVKVGRAPDPFEDREKSVLKNNSIAVDARERDRRAPTPGTPGPFNGDSFDHRAVPSGQAVPSAPAVPSGSDVPSTPAPDQSME